jgi:RNA polymerase sigma-70 factor (ECF subfamily)
LTEEQIIKGCVNKQADCQRMLFDQYAGKMMSLCLRYANDHQTAQDFLQLGFIKVFDFVHQYKGAGSFEGWMRRIFVSIAIREISKRKMDVSAIDAMETDLSFDEPGIISKLTEDEIHALVRTLPLGYRTVFNLKVIEGYSHEDIASMLNIQPATSRSQLLKARTLLKALISKRYNTVIV